MLSKNVIENWVNSLIFLGKEENKINSYLTDINNLTAIIKLNPEIIKIWNSKKISKPIRKKMIDDVFKNRINPYILNFLKLLVDDLRMTYLPVILKSTRLEINQINDVLYGKIFSVIPISNEDKSKVQNWIGKKLSKKIQLINVIDDSLIGGIKIKVGNYIFDGSIQGKINAMRQKIIQKNNE